MLKPWKAAQSPEELFIERYEQMLSWALHLTDHDRELAEDLLHDAFIQFSFGHRDLNAIHNLEGYLYGMLRNLHLSQERRASRSRFQQLSVIEYESAETGIRTVDPRDQIHVQDQLRRVCHYAGVRKEQAKLASVLILRFFHGYYPSEIAQILRSPRLAINKWLLIARSEAKLWLTDPRALSFMGENPVVEIKSPDFARAPSDFLSELSQMIFSSCRSDCPPKDELQDFYRDANAKPITCQRLAHVVSCPECLEEVNRLLDLPSLSNRYPTDTMGKDTRPKGSSGGGGGGSTPGGRAPGRSLEKSKRRAREAFEHHPQELCISVNGYIQGAQRISSERSELDLNVNLSEQIGFVEVFSEQGIRLLLMSVDESPPAGPVKQSARVELSDGRTLNLTLRFRNPWPTLHATYHDPTFKQAEAVGLAELEHDTATGTGSNQVADGRRQEAGGRTLPSAQASGNEHKEVDVGARRKPQLLTRLNQKLFKLSSALRKQGFWTMVRQPAAVTAILALILISGLLLMRRAPTPPVTAVDLLQRSSAAEDAAAARVDSVLHRTLQLEERKVGQTVSLSGDVGQASSGQLITRHRIDVWQSAEKGVTARRLYDEKGQLVAGDWIRKDGETDDSRTIYRSHKLGDKRTTEESQSTIDNRQLAIGNVEVWQLSPSATEFSSLIGIDAQTHVEERRDSYVISYARGGQVPGAGGQGLVKATLTLSRSDLHATELTLVVASNEPNPKSEIRNPQFLEYRFVEAVFEWNPPNVVAPSVFEPDPELLGENETRGSGDTETVSASPRLPVAVSPVAAASAELEVEVLRLLNQAGADMGEQVNLTRTPEGRLRVEGIVETSERKADILRALAPVVSNSALAVSIVTTEEAVNRQLKRSQSQPSDSPVVQQAEPPTKAIPVDAELRRYFSGRGWSDDQLEANIYRFASRMVGHSSSALQHAWALKRLSTRFSPDELHALSPEARAKWVAMMVAHARALEQETSNLRQELAPIFFPATVSADVPLEIEIRTDEDLARAGTRLVELCTSHHNLIRAAFAISSGSSSAAAIRDVPFQRSLRSAEKLAAQISKQ